MKEKQVTRRTAIARSTAGVLAGSVGVGTPPLMAASRGSAEVDALPSDPVEQLRAWVRMIGTMAEDRVVKKTRGKIFAVLPDQVLLLYGMRGSESTWWRQVDDQTFVRFNSTMSFFTDPATGEFIDTYTSPINGATVEMPVSYIRHKEGEWFTPNGIYYGSMKSLFPDVYPDKPLQLDWTLDGDLIRCQKGDSFPPILPEPSIEYTSFFAHASEVFDANLDRARTWSAGWNIMAGTRFPYRELGVLPGHVNWHYDAVKLDDVEQLDADYLARARDHSERFDISPALDEGPSFFERMADNIQKTRDSGL